MQIPDLEQSLRVINMLQKQKNSADEFEARYLLSSQVYTLASIPPTDKVCLWLGVSKVSLRLLNSLAHFSMVKTNCVSDKLYIL